MNDSVAHRKLVLHAIVFFALATLCSLPRFGQRENEHMPAPSDSDIYIEMAGVFTGQIQDFDRERATREPHHYNRPLFPFVAGCLAKLLPGGNLRAAFSLIDLIAATLVSILLLRQVMLWRPAGTSHWMPSVLFLSAFPQINWGYHILTDTLGLGTAFASASLASRLVSLTADGTWTSAKRQASELAALFVLSSLAFLARETAWLAVITAVWLILEQRGRWKSGWLGFGLILLALVAGKIPHSIYSHAWRVTGVTLRFSPDILFDPRYMMDFFVKTGVCFNLAWILALATLLRRNRQPVPPFVLGWTGAAMLYMGAGYFANSQAGIGYPLRMSFTLFPVVFLYAADLFEGLAPARRRLLLVTGYCVLQWGINFVGLLLDPGRSQFRTSDVLKVIREFFR